MASKILRPFWGCCPKTRFTRLERGKLELTTKRNMSEYKKQMKEVEKHAEETFLTWKNISLFIALPVSTYLFYKHVIVGEHIERPKEFIGYGHMRIRRKAFPWGDGDKSLFHNEKYNVGPDTDFDAEEEHDDKHEEPFLTRLIRHFTPKVEDLRKERDDYLVKATIASVENLEYLQQPKLPPVPGDIFGVYDRMTKPRPYSVDD